MQSKRFVIIDIESGWIEAFSTNDRTTLTVKKSLSAVLARFGVPENVVSDNGPNFGTDDFKTCSKSQENYKIGSTIYQPRANGLAERDSSVNFFKFLQRVLLTHRNTSEAKA